MKPVIFSELKTAEAALEHIELLQQLSPNLTYENAKIRLNEMYALGSYSIFAASKNATVVGLCGVWIATKLYSGKYAELDNVVVHKAYRNQHIGEALCTHVLKIAKEKGCEMAMLDAYLENTSGHRFYHLLGFYPRGFHFLKRL